jgi:hypothetical protein
VPALIGPPQAGDAMHCMKRGRLWLFKRRYSTVETYDSPSEGHRSTKMRDGAVTNYTLSPKNLSNPHGVPSSGQLHQWRTDRDLQRPMPWVDLARGAVRPCSVVKPTLSWRHTPPIGLTIPSETKTLWQSTRSNYSRVLASAQPARSCDPPFGPSLSSAARGSVTNRCRYRKFGTSFLPSNHSRAPGNPKKSVPRGAGPMSSSAAGEHCDSGADTNQSGFAE